MHSFVWKIKVVTHVTKKKFIIIIEMKSQIKTDEHKKHSFLNPSQKGVATMVASFCMGTPKYKLWGGRYEEFYPRFYARGIKLHN